MSTNYDDRPRGGGTTMMTIDRRSMGVVEADATNASPPRLSLLYR